MVTNTYLNLIPISLIVLVNSERPSSLLVSLNPDEKIEYYFGIDNTSVLVLVNSSNELYHPQSTDFEDDIYHHEMIKVPLWYYTSFCVVLTSVGINGGLLNGLVIRMFLKNQYVQTPYNNIIFNLAFAEFMMAVVGVSHDVVALTQNGWKLGKLMCVSTGALITTCGFVSILTICTLSICRYESILQFDKSFEKVTSNKKSLLIISFIWIYSLIISIPPLLGWGRYVPEISGLGCVPDWYSENMSYTHFIFMFVFGFGMPTSVIIVSSILTCCEARDLNKFIGVFVDKEIRLVKYRTIQKNFRLVLSMNVAYLVCWGTYVAFCLTHQYIDDSQVGQMLSMLPSVAIKCNVCLNPILYIAFNPHFRGPVTGRMIRNEKRKDMILKRARMKKDEEEEFKRNLEERMKKKENDTKEKENNGLDSSLKPLKLILKETKAKNNFAIRSLRKKKRKPLIDKD